MIGKKPPFPWLALPQWRAASLRERALLWAAFEADITKAHEIGENSGPRVEEYLSLVGVPAGSPWCAAFVGWCYRQAGAVRLPALPAAVRGWASSSLVELVSSPQRGDLFYWLRRNGRGHIGLVTRVGKVWVETIEGNTNSAGSREGDRVMRRRRLRAGLKFLRWRED